MMKTTKSALLAMSEQEEDTIDTKGGARDPRCSVCWLPATTRVACEVGGAMVRGWYCARCRRYIMPTRCKERSHG